MYSFSVIMTFLFGVLLSLPVIYANSPWLDCVLTTAVTAVGSTYCAGRSYPYAYYVGGILIGNNCYCGSEASVISPVNYVAPSTSLTTNCLPILQAGVFDTSSTFSYTGCYASSSLLSALVNTVTGVLGTTVSSPPACFQMCADTRAAYYTPYLLGLSTLTPRYGCVCGDETIVSGAPTLCGLGQFYAYSHSVAAAASAFPKRKRAHERILAQKRSEVIKERNWDCPTGMRACNIDGVANSWECIDPNTELESCGGCRYGDYSANGNSSEPMGADCTALPGVLRNSVTCSDGKCEAFACKRGWTLRDRECVKTFTFQL
ncbi:delayed-type hypersensitivity antigen [Cryptococcus neoformans var. grubii Br795]|nr:delayed-type hypersensitivity antigen [Cryptococcus neoformans var. grubii Br795]